LTRIGIEDEREGKTGGGIEKVGEGMKGTIAKPSRGMNWLQNQRSSFTRVLKEKAVS